MIRISVLPEVRSENGVGVGRDGIITPEEKKIAGYADAKHALLALKILKKEIEAPAKATEKAKYKEDVAKLFVAGYGQPGGGVLIKNCRNGR